jgi:hypothetical protein
LFERLREEALGLTTLGADTLACIVEQRRQLRRARPAGRIQAATGEDEKRRHRGFAALCIGHTPHTQAIKNAFGAMIEASVDLDRIAVQKIWRDI